MLWGSFTYYVVGSLLPVEGMMNSDKYIEVVDKKVVRDLENAFPDGSGILQQDSAPCHKSKKVTKFFESKKITVSDWPGNSQDLNPFENLWSIIKKSTS